MDGAGLERVLRAESRLVLALVHSRGCEPCRRIRPAIEELASTGADVCRVVGVDADAHPDVAQSLGVGGFPTLVFFRDGKEIHRFLGGALPPSVTQGGGLESVLPANQRRSSDD